MLWGFGQVHRQHFRASLRFITRCHFIHLSRAIYCPSPLFHHSRWATAAALAVRSKSDVAEPVAQYARDVKLKHSPSARGKGEANSGKTRRGAKSDAKSPILPLELLAAIDTLFTRNMDLEAALSYLHKTPSSAVLLDQLQHRDHARVLAENLAATRVPQRALRTLDVAHNLGIQFKQNAYECVAHQLAEGDYWDLVLAVVKLGKRHTGRTTVRLLNWRARALIEISHFGLLRGVLGEFRDEELQPNKRTFHLLLSGHIRNRDLGKAKECMNQMKEAGFPVDASTHALIVSVYRSLGPDAAVQQKAFDALPELGERDATIVLNSLIQFSLDANDLTEALRYLSMFDPLHDGAFQSESSSDDAHDSVRQLSTDAATFTMLINYVSQDGDPSRIASITEKMDAFGVKPDNILVAAVIRALCVAGDVESAVSIVAPMCNSDSTSMSLWQRIGLDSTKPNSISLPISPDLSPDIHIFNALLRGASTTFGINGSRAVLRLMRANWIVPNAATIGILTAYLNNDEKSQPRTLIRTTRSLLSGSIRPDIKHLNAILKAVIRQEQAWSRKTNLSRGSMDVDQETSRFDLLAGTEFPTKLSYRSMTQNMTRSLISKRVRGDRVTVALRMKQAIAHRDLEGAEAAFRTMLERGMHANAYHYSALMQAHASLGKIATAESVFRSAVEAGVKPNATMYTILIVGRKRWRDPRRAMRVFEKMVSQGIKPDKPSIHAVANAFYAVGSHGIARRVLMDLWAHIGHFPKELQNASFRDLVKVFRALSTDGIVPPSGKQQRMLRWKLRRLMQTWRPLPVSRNRVGGRAK